MADEIGDGSSGYINHVALYILGRVALQPATPTGLAQAGRTAAQLRQPRESPSGQRLGGWLAALLADAGGGPPAAPSRSSCSIRWRRARYPPPARSGTPTPPR